MTRPLLAKVYSGAVSITWRTMTVLSASARLARWRGYINQLLMVILINVPTVSFGLAMGWVSLASGESGPGAGGELVAAAATTFAASLVGVPLSARAIAAGRKFAVLATSAAFVVCWSLKLCGEGWWLVAARVAAGLGGAGAWSVAPLLAKEMCERSIGGAAVAALVLAHNLGFLFMYLAADARVPHTTVLWCCLALSAGHFVVFLFVPESPAYLAANGKLKEAASSLAWLRGRQCEDPALTAELKALPAPDDSISSPLQLAKDLLSDRRRRRAFIISAIAVVGQEMCGVFALLQFAEHVFVLARDERATASETPRLSGVSGAPPHGATELMSPARLAVWLGVVQLVASAVALYLVERVGRRPLIVVCAYATGASLACGAGAAWLGAGGAPAGWALAAAVAADSAGLQPAPYALLADCFHYQYRGCALMLVMAAASVGNAVEVFIFPVVATSGGITSALALAALLTLAYAVFATVAVPETRGRTPEQIYDEICPPKEREQSKDQTCPEKPKTQEGSDCVVTVQNNSETEYTSM